MKNSSPSRFGSFFSRVEAERQVLGLVNAKLGHLARLHGLTSAAILRWRGEILDSGLAGDFSFDLILDLLHRISVRSDAQADQSRVVFDDQSSSKLPIIQLVDKLRMILAEKNARTL